MEAIELDHSFQQAVDGEPADAPWSRVAALLAINRLCAPGSELAIEQRWYHALSRSRDAPRFQCHLMNFDASCQRFAFARLPHPHMT
jgi:hypothetical protein